MEVFMRILVSVMALAVALAWPSVGDAQSKAQSKKSSARSGVVTKQKVRPPAKAAAVRGASQRPCAGHLWWGCVGWDPDPNVRATLVRDYSDDP
jgi:hypothetical protein